MQLQDGPSFKAKKTPKPQNNINSEMMEYNLHPVHFTEVLENKRIII